MVLLVVLSGASVWGLGSSLPTSHAPAAASASVAPDLATHGDLYVAAGETYTIHPSPGTHEYYQGGNITVAAGGTLIISNVSLTFVEYVGTTGTAQQRLDHLYTFDDAGTVEMYNSTLTTDLQVINAYAKLAVTVTGIFTAWNSSFAFPGWVLASGVGAVLTFNDSTVRNNPQVANVSEPLVIQGDTEFAPQLNATDGAQVNFFDSSFQNTYADDFLINGMPGPAPLNTTAGFTAPATGNVNVTALATPTDAANLTQDWLYPDGISAGTVSISYTDNNTLVNTTATGVTIWYDGQAYPTGTSLKFVFSTTGVLTAPAPVTLINAINAGGMLNYLNATGSFGAGPLEFAIEITGLSGGGPIWIPQMGLILSPELSYDLSVSGSPTVLNAVDSSLDLTFTQAPVSPLAMLAPYPWDSNKLLVDDGAVANLANITVSNPLPGVFSYSAIQPDATSQVYLYRWAQFNLTGRGGTLPIYQGMVKAFYAYNTNQSNNQTANALNDLATANPSIWGYVNYVDLKDGLPGYGVSGRSGHALLLLASGNLTGPTLPDGVFLGGYHVLVQIPITTNNSEAFNWTVSPYPSGVAQGSAFAGSPDFGPAITFPGYFGQLAFGAQTLTQNLTALVNGTVDDYKVLGVEVLLMNSGTATIYNFTGNLTYGGSPGIVVSSVPLTNVTLSPGASTPIEFTWLVNTSVTGIAGSPNHPFVVNTTYNGGTAKLGGGTITETIPISVSPYVARFAYSAIGLTGNGSALPNGTVRIGQDLEFLVTLTYSGAATVTSLSAALYYEPASAKPLETYSGIHLDFNTPGQQTTLNFSWLVNDTVTGLKTAVFQNDFYLTLLWNGGEVEIGGNNSTRVIPVSIAPSDLRISTFSPAPGTIDLTTTSNYFTSGTLQFNGSQAATIVLYATPVSGGLPVQIGGGTSAPGYGSGAGDPGVFAFSWFPLAGLLSPGTTYTITLTATYNGVETNATLGTSAVPPSTSPVQSILFEKFLGLPLWVWLAIAVAAIVAILAVLFISRRSAAGKLVECGECGNLIPEDATVCPKCGAEFETDLIRCSRCASTIPADSKFCPECAAQLLGKAGEGGEDAERQGYSDFTEKYRAEAKRELGENYNEGSFWDWWKRQPSYVSYSQWKMQQGQGATRTGMGAPPSGTETAPEPPVPPKGGSGGPAVASMRAPPAPSTPSAGTPPAAAPTATDALKPCPNCGKEIPPEYLVCPFCGSVTQ